MDKISINETHKKEKKNQQLEHCKQRTAQPIHSLACCDITGLTAKQLNNFCFNLNDCDHTVSDTCI